MQIVFVGASGQNVAGYGQLVTTHEQKCTPNKQKCAGYEQFVTVHVPKCTSNEPIVGGYEQKCEGYK